MLDHACSDKGNKTVFHSKLFIIQVFFCHCSVHCSVHLSIDVDVLEKFETVHFQTFQLNRNLSKHDYLDDFLNKYNMLILHDIQTPQNVFPAFRISELKCLIKKTI